MLSTLTLTWLNKIGRHYIVFGFGSNIASSASL